MFSHHVNGIDWLVITAFEELTNKKKPTSFNFKPQIASC